MKITLELLKKHGACEGQRNKFAELYPEGADVTVESLALAREQGLEVTWLERLIPLGRWEAYRAATAAVREACDAAIDAAWKVYEAATTAAGEAYDAAINAAAGEAYKAAIDVAWEEYRAAIAPARAVYYAAIAPAREARDAAVAAALVAAFDCLTD